MPAKYKRPSLRKHVTTACIPCRDGKVKVVPQSLRHTPSSSQTDQLQCDGATPTCRNCASKGRLCRYRQSNDKRKVQVRVAVGLLARRVDALARYIEDIGLPVPKIEEHDYLVLKSIFEALELTCDDLDANAGRGDEIEVDDEIHAGERAREVHSMAGNGVKKAQSMGGSKAETLNPVSSVSTTKGTDGPQTSGMVDSYIPEENDAGPDQHPAPRASLRLVATPQFQENGSDDESDDEVTDQLACRLGRLQLTHDGQLRYFGSTSNLTLLDALVDLTPPVAVAKDASELLESAKLDKEIDEAFERHLLELFFAWQDPCLHVVDAETFWRARAQSRYEGIATPYFSGTLSDAMCALGAAYEPRYHPEVVTFPRSLSEFFGDRAKILLELELESPSIATIQGLVILSNHEALCTRDTRGWLYSGKRP